MCSNRDANDIASKIEKLCRNYTAPRRTQRMAKEEVDVLTLFLQKGKRGREGYFTASAAEHWLLHTLGRQTLVTSQPLSQTLVTSQPVCFKHWLLQNVTLQEMLAMLEEMLEMLEEMLVRCEIIKAARDTSRTTDLFPAPIVMNDVSPTLPEQNKHCQIQAPSLKKRRRLRRCQRLAAAGVLLESLASWQNSRRRGASPMSAFKGE